MHNSGFLLVFLVLLSCSDTTYLEYHSFNNNAWDSDSAVIFNYTILDTTKKYNLSLKIRHTVDYEFQNLFLFLDGEKKDTVEIMLANKNGKWKGVGVSNVRELEYFFDKEKVFLQRKEYELRIEQAMRYGDVEKIKKLDHILDIGLIVSEYDE